MNEEWKAIPGAGGMYEASSLGRIRTTRPHPRGRTPAGHVLAPSVHANGYLNVGIHVDGRRRVIGVHRLVCAAFHGVPQPAWEARHMDGDQTNNAASNLRWGTHSDNVRDSVAAGTHYSHGRTLTACKRGHPFEGENYYVDGTGRRVCRPCRNYLARERRRNQKAAAAATN